MRWYSLIIFTLLAVFFIVRSNRARSREAAKSNIERHLGDPGARKALKGAARLASSLLARAERTRYAAKMRAALELSGLEVSWNSFRLLWIFSLISLPFLAVTLTGKLLSAPITISALILVPAPILVALRLRSERRSREQCDMFASDLALYLYCTIPIEEAVALCVQDLRPPLSDTLRRFLGEVALGASVVPALLSLKDSLESTDLELIVGAAVTSRETGADIKAIMANIGDAVRERAAIRRELHSLTIQGRLSGRIVAGLPLIFLGLSALVSRETLSVLTGTVPGVVILTVAGSLDALGFLWIRKILDIKT